MSTPRQVQNQQVFYLEYINALQAEDFLRCRSTNMCGMTLRQFDYETG